MKKSLQAVGHAPVNRGNDGYREERGHHHDHRNRGDRRHDRDDD